METRCKTLWAALSVSDRLREEEEEEEALHQICENETFIESIAAAAQGAENGQTFLRRSTSAVEQPVTDLADTLPWICPNATG